MSAIVVYGEAAAWQVDKESMQNVVEACIAAAKAGPSILLKGGSALDAAETLVNTP